MSEKRIPHLGEAASKEESSSTTIDSSQKSRERVALKYSTFSYGCSLPLFVLFLLSFTLLGCLLHSSLYHQLDPKGCMMTYMQPTYYRILGFDKDYTDLAGKYGLLLYRDEGDEHPALHPSQLTQTDDRDWSIAKSAKIRPNGVPALFIPGNAGSARQVRSIAKEATRYYNEKIQKGLRAPWSKPIDFFTGFHSNTAFPRPTSVLIIGHSMGGIVARTLFTMDNFIPGSINTILTIASPHMVPPLALDYTVTSIYDMIEEFWIRGYDTPHGMLANVSLVSIMGGNQDITVNSDAGNIHHIVPQSHGFSVFTSSIPHAWVGSDHLSILWCNQVVRQIGIALVEVIDASTPNQVKPLDERMKIFRNHLLWEDSLSTSSISKGTKAKGCHVQICSLVH
ncbi:GPI inositol deacylase [Mortierella sp. AD011]|nr:GPI inositol deacylase [Mortierella sp. AD011]